MDWNTPEGREAFYYLLQFVNIRMYRGSGKSSIGTHSTLLWHATRDPNETIALMSFNDDGAAAFCQQVRKTMQGELYRLFFPERIPEGDLRVLWTEDRLWFGGRTIPHPQWTVEARGFTSSWARTHFNRFFTDDIVTEANSSPVELAKVHRNLGNMRGLYMPKRDVWRHHLGTVYDERDDHYFLRNIGHCLTLVVPIEIYPNGAPDSIEERGIPTNPEWHPLEEVEKIQKEVSGDEKEGPLSYKRNFWLDPNAGVGDRIFPASLVDRSKYDIVLDLGLPKLQRKKTNKDGRIELVKLDPFKQLSVALGIDPSFSMGGDEWAISAVGIDHDEVAYQLETVAGRGWEGLKSFMKVMIDKWHPRVVGFEKAGAQEQNFKTLLEYDRYFRRHAEKFVSVSHDNAAKDVRIINNVREPMLMKKLLLNPKERDTHAEMTAYVPGRKAKDNRLDSIAIGMTVLRKGRGSSSDIKKKWQRQANRYHARRDPITKVRIA